MVSDRWLKVGAVFGIIACVAFAAACGGGGGGGGGGSSGGGDTVAFLNGSVSFASAATKPVAGKPGGIRVYRVSRAAEASDAFVAVPGATIEIIDIDTDTVVATTTADSTGAYALTDQDFVTGYTASDYASKYVKVRATFEGGGTAADGSTLEGTAGTQYVVEHIVNMADITTANVDTYSATLDPLTTAIMERIITVIEDFGLTLTTTQLAALEELVAVITTTIQNEDATIAFSAADFDASATDRSAIGDAFTSAVIDAVFSTMETDFVDVMDSAGITIGLSAAELRIVKKNKFINWLGSMGFLVDDGNGNVFIRVNEYIEAPDGSQFNAVDLLVGYDADGDGNPNTDGVGLPESGVIRAIDALEAVVEGSSAGLAPNMLLVNLDTLFAVDSGLPTWTDPDGNTHPQVDHLIDLALVDGDKTTTPPTWTTSADQVRAHAIREIWEQVEESKAIFGKELLRELAVNRKNERISIQEIATAIAANFEWYTEDMMAFGGMIQHFEDRKLDAAKDPHGPTVTVSQILAELVGVIPASAYDYAVQIASSDTSIFEMAEEVLMDLVFKEFQADNTFDPYNDLFKNITSFDDARAIVEGSAAGDYSAVTGVTVTATSHKHTERIEGIKSVLLSSLPSAWFGTTVTKDTSCSFKTAMLMIIKTIDQNYLLDKTLGYMRTTTDPGTGEEFTEPRWDNFKWMQPKESIQETFDNVGLGIDPVLKVFLEALFDGVDPDGTAYKAADGTTDLTALAIDTSLAATVDVAALDRVRQFKLWFHDEFHKDMDMAGEMQDMGVMNPVATAQVRFQVKNSDDSIPTTISSVTASSVVWSDGGTPYDFSDDTETVTAVPGTTLLDANGYVTTIGTIGALAVNSEYKFIFSFSDRTDTVEFYVYVPKFLPETSPGSGIGMLDMTMWGDVFWLPPQGGFQDFPWAGMVLDEKDPSGNAVGIDLAGFETGMMISTTYDLRLESGSVNLVIGSGSTAYDITGPNPTYYGLNFLLGQDVSGLFTGTTLASLPITPANFDGTAGTTQYSGYLLGVTNSAGKKFIVELGWYDEWSQFLDIRFGKVDAYNKLVAPNGTGFMDFGDPAGTGGGGGSMWLMSGDHMNLETWEWAPPAFTPEGGDAWAVQGRANAHVAYNLTFDPTSATTLASTDLKTLSAVGSNATLAAVSDTDIDTNGDGAINATSAAEFASLLSTAGVTLGSSASAFPGQLVVVKTSGGDYYLLRIQEVWDAEMYDDTSGASATNQFYPGDMGFIFAADDDGNGVPDWLPHVDVTIAGGTEEVPAIDGNYTTLTLDDSSGYAYDFETNSFSSWGDGASDICYTTAFGGTDFEVWVTALPESWTVWQDVDPACIGDHFADANSNMTLDGEENHEPVSEVYYSLFTAEGSLVVFRVAGAVGATVDIEWRMYGGGGGGGLVPIADYFPCPATAAGTSAGTFTFTFDSSSGSSGSGSETWTYQGASTTPNSVAVPGRIDRAVSGGGTDIDYIGYATNNDLVYYGINDGAGNWITYSPGIKFSSPTAVVGQEFYTSGTVTDSSGSKDFEAWSRLDRLEDLTIGAVTYEKCLVIQVTIDVNYGDSYTDQIFYLYDGTSGGAVGNSGIVREERYKNTGAYWEYEVGERQ